MRYGLQILTTKCYVFLFDIKLAFNYFETFVADLSGAEFSFVSSCVFICFDIISCITVQCLHMFAIPVPGCPGCGEGSGSVREYWKNPRHSNGSQVISQLH